MGHRLTSFLLLILALNTGWFVLHSATLGMSWLTNPDAEPAPRVFRPDAPLSNSMLALHMITGAILSFAAPLQALPILRNRWPGLHRRLGYTLFALALITGFGGVFYIASVGTVGGPWMSVWFALYGAAISLAAANTVYYVLSKDLQRHFEWATRFVILAVGSWIYRMHYGLWYAVTGGIGSNEAFTGLFDRVTVVAFFVPYLLIAEGLLRRRRTRGITAKRPSG